jgi:hypothetical protein
MILVLSSTGLIKKLLVWTEEVFELLEKAKTVRGWYSDPYGGVQHMAAREQWRAKELGTFCL